MLHWVNNDAHVAAPNDQIAGLRMSHTLEVAGAVVQRHRVLITVGETCAIVNQMDEMRAILADGAMVRGFHGCAKNGQAFIECEQAGGSTGLNCGRVGCTRFARFLVSLRVDKGRSCAR
jgi:hypothetical protein